MPEINLSLPPYKPEYEGLTLSELKVLYPNEKWPDFSPPAIFVTANPGAEFIGLDRK